MYSAPCNPLLPTPFYLPTFPSGQHYQHITFFNYMGQWDIITWCGTPTPLPTQTDCEHTSTTDIVLPTPTPDIINKLVDGGVWW